MSGFAPKWAVRRFTPPPVQDAYWTEYHYPAMKPCGHEQTFDTWRDVCVAADTILGDHDLMIGKQPTDPVVIQHGGDIVLIYLKLELT